MTRYDALPDLSGLHLGYAQTKVVAEALVREAGRRGLPVSIYRPSLIAGHSETGAFNSGDILARVVSGCVRMGTAPDLDWTLDCLPVDTAARRIIALSTRRGVSHLRHNRPRHWRECVLWMRLYGYDVRLVPYHAWLRQLAHDTERDGRSHPLRPLRSFFLNRPAGVRGRTQPELLLGSDRVFRAGAQDRDPDSDPIPLWTPRCFNDTSRRSWTAGCCRLRPSARRSVSPRPLDAAFFSTALNTTISAAQPLGRLSDHSIVSELTAWRSGCATGLFRYRLRGDHLDRDVVVKVKAPDHDVIAVGDALARLCDARIGDAYARWADRIGFVAADIRELAIYAQIDPRFTRHAPAALGSAVDPVSGVCTLVLEEIANARLQDSVDQPELWTAARHRLRDPRACIPARHLVRARACAPRATVDRACRLDRHDGGDVRSVGVDRRARHAALLCVGGSRDRSDSAEAREHCRALVAPPWRRCRERSSTTTSTPGTSACATQSMGRR